MLIIPHTTLSQDALYGVLDDFINREGTDYGVDSGMIPGAAPGFEEGFEGGFDGNSGYEPGQTTAGPSLEQKRRRLLLQLEQNKIVITFDPLTESTSLILASAAESRNFRHPG